jgi:hypothetical protein
MNTLHAAESGMAKLVHDAMVWAANQGGQPQPWQDGNSIAEGYARTVANQIVDTAINIPETENFMLGFAAEAAHQRARWPSAHDEGKSPFDWFWLIGYLAQKAAGAAVAGDLDKAKHHTISTAAALFNWHLALTGADNSMQPGAPVPKEGE